MPYLHWERAEEFQTLNAIIDERKKKKRSEEMGIPVDDKRKGTAEIPPNADVELLSNYLEHNPPLHCRRTLDQYYYHTLPNTSRRDKDQTPMRYFRSKEDTVAPDEIVTMVDQLWMWVLPPCGSSPPTVITAFPQRSLRKNPQHATALVSNIIRMFLKLEGDLRSCDSLAEIIASECSMIYLASKSSWDKRLQFLEIYTSSIAQIVSGPSSLQDSFRLQLLTLL